MTAEACQMLMTKLSTAILLQPQDYRDYIDDLDAIQTTVSEEKPFHLLYDEHDGQLRHPPGYPCWMISANFGGTWHHTFIGIRHLALIKELARDLRAMPQRTNEPDEKEKEHDQENKERLAGEVGTREESVEAESIEGTGEEAAPAGGVLQA